MYTTRCFHMGVYNWFQAHLSYCSHMHPNNECWIVPFPVFLEMLHSLLPSCFFITTGFLSHLSCHLNPLSKRMKLFFFSNKTSTFFLLVSFSFLFCFIFTCGYKKTCSVFECHVILLSFTRES